MSMTRKTYFLIMGLSLVVYYLIFLVMFKNGYVHQTSYVSAFFIIFNFAFVKLVRFKDKKEEE